ncbi:MAG: hypothetical protein COY38_05175 [Candidatus Aenigmarchaeota archaeon CG_4_10_14_0_8_um_filter_37_24]|nr:hypothetical protein [Candidatus Aenigmarchaeota archaeon]OIN88323.1 MAG: hypothetical protein AUJ50_01220 [Candidatus Aenigmarchaeota archaeon CG1_02_38_14]PIV68158.1 MAG: hypothetical protein COS07_05110 [Candidatus Aenigmarchaeota archaeon CG01_land_8_20_14_3_00_37_9]PIW40802.1 MAG: hypothetical protein COW21_05255 [Candidatus Aenigmarchaeota archaeon CG15_BIG_FIL_POST_REV_8_21_14_020_37_27]PIX50285.1 MAG: hypothetical protein COZ52_05030 [Candidatus Aenigmarchaeota archaeon CG_4_8_14_3_u
MVDNSNMRLYNAIRGETFTPVELRELLAGYTLVSVRNLGTEDQRVGEARINGCVRDLTVLFPDFLPEESRWRISATGQCETDVVYRDGFYVDQLLD